MKDPKWTATLVMLVACVAAVVGGRMLFGDGDPPGPGSGQHPRTLGRPQADVRIVEYVDYECGACQSGSTLIHEYFKRYPSRLFVEVKFYPLSGHRHALPAAIYAECAAGQRKFWPFHDLLFERQADWRKEKDPAHLFREYARTAGLDPEKLEACVASEETKARIEQEKSQGFAAGVRSTPTFFINGNMIVGGLRLTQELDRYFPHEKPSGSR
jgi:protein-disulfide isomerase